MGLRKMHSRAVETQRVFLQGRKPFDAYVASSFGASVLLQLMVEKTVPSAPVMLCAPAQTLIGKYSGTDFSDRLETYASEIVVVHGTNDATVPLQHSRLLVEKLRRRGITASLVESDNDDHRLSKFFAGRAGQERVTALLNGLRK